jgi:hypothetical protein
MVKAMDLSGWARRNWVFPLLLPLFAIEYAFARATDWRADGLAEFAILFDLCLFAPALHYLCYRRSLAPRPLLIRTFALASLGVYIASKLVPPDAQMLLGSLGWLRMAGLAVLALIELGLLLAVVKLVFGGRSTAQEIAERSGAPQWIVRLMLLEARFWKALWRIIRGR